RRRHTRFSRDWSSDVCSSDLTVPGKSLRSMVIAFAPGASLPPHDHAPSAFLYHRVLEGAVRSSLNGWPVQAYGAGEGFYEKPGRSEERRVGTERMWGWWRAGV